MDTKDQSYYVDTLMKCGFLRKMLMDLNLHDRLSFNFKSIGRQWGKIPKMP